MVRHRVPAICDDCGSVFPSGFAFGGRVTVVMTGNKSGPCPVCGGMGSVPDGVYEAFDEVVKATSMWTAVARHELEHELQAATEAEDPAAAEAALQKRPDLLAIANRVLTPKTPADLMTYVLVVLAALQMHH